ncbi:hypothetical protein Tco_0431598 [Tanacetum coccineum]
MSFLKRRSFKVKELQEKCIIKAFKLSHQEQYEHVGPKSQDHKMARLQDDVKILFLVDDLKKFKNTFISRRTQALEQETQDLDAEIKQMKVFKAGYGVTTLQELRRNQD